MKKWMMMVAVAAAAAMAFGQAGGLVTPPAGGGAGDFLSAPDGYRLGVDSAGWLDAGAWVEGGATNGRAADVALGVYAGYPWLATYTQWTNGQQGRVYVASLAAPPFDGAKLTGLRFLYRALNAADTVDVLVYPAGSGSAIITQTLAVTFSENVHEAFATNFSVTANSGFTLKATVKVTAETDEGSWTALPRAEANWSK